MIKLIQTTNIEQIKTLVWFEPKTDSKWYLIKDENKLIGLFELQDLTGISANLHMHIFPIHQKKGYGIQAFREFYNLIKQENKIKRLIAMIPIQNTFIVKVILKTKATVCGLIPNGIKYNNQIQDVVLFQLEVI